MVCSANICRSPMAQGVMRRELAAHGLDRIVEVDSAGTQVPRPGHRPDPRARQVAESHGASIRKFKARRIVADDFQRFDYIIAMDWENLRSLEAICPEEYKNKLFLIMEFTPRSDLEEVPDPYFGNLSGFERVQGLLDMGCKGLLNHIMAKHGFTL